MQEIFLLPIKKSQLKQIEKSHSAEILPQHIYRESLYVLFYDEKTRAALKLARIESTHYACAGSKFDPLEYSFKLKIGPTFSLGQKLVISKDFPAPTSTFDQLFLCIEHDSALIAAPLPDNKESDILETSYLEQVLDYVSTNKIQDALPLLHKALLLNTQNAMTHYYLANISVDGGNLNMALYHYSHTLSLQPTFAQALDYMGLAWMHKNDSEKALDCWDRSLAIDPNGEFALQNKGKILLQLKRYELAKVSLEKAANLNEGDYFTRNLLGVACANMNDLAGAINNWKLVIKAKKDDEYLHLNLARALAENGDYKEALAEYHLLLELFPEDHELHEVIQKTITKIQSDIKNTDSVRREPFSEKDLSEVELIEKNLQIVISLMGENHKINFQKLAEYLKDFGYHFKAVDSIIFDSGQQENWLYSPEFKALHLGEKPSTNTRSLRNALEQAAEKIPQMEEEDDSHIKTIELNNDDEELDVSRLDQAIENTRRMLVDDDENEWGWYSLGSLLAQKGDFEESVIHFTKSAELNPNNAITLYALGLAYVRLNLLEKAANALQRAIIAKPDNQLQAVYDEWNFRDSLPYFGLGDVLIRMSRFTDAIDVFKKGLVSDATSSLAHFQLGTCYEVTENYDAAIESLTNALSLDPDFPYAYSKLGIVYYKIDQFMEAMAMLQKAVSFDTADSESFFFLGETAYQLGKFQEARNAWNMTMQVSTPEDIYYRKAQDRLMGKPEKDSD